MNRVCEPIRDRAIIENYLNYLKGKNERDFLIAKFQFNTGLRISDVVPIKVSDLMTENLIFRTHFEIKEEKTEKTKKIKLNETLKKAIKNYVTNNLQYESYLFKSRKGQNNHITPTQAYRILKSAANVFKIEKFGTHSLRKSWGYWGYKQSKFNIALIMAMFGHTREKDTLIYIGIQQDDKDELYSIVQF